MENKDLRKVLEIYREDTLNLISSLEKDNVDGLEGLSNKRQQTIDCINNLEYTQQEFLEIIEELQILVYQKKLSDLILQKRNAVKEELNRMSNVKNASYMYNKKMYSGSMVFNKTI